MVDGKSLGIFRLSLDSGCLDSPCRKQTPFLILSWVQTTHSIWLGREVVYARVKMATVISGDGWSSTRDPKQTCALSLQVEPGVMGPNR